MNSLSIAFFNGLGLICLLSVKWWCRSFYVNHHYHHVVLVARISLILSRHFSLSFIASGRSSELHPVSSHSCWMYVRAGRPAFARPCVGSIRVHHLWARHQWSISNNYSMNESVITVVFFFFFLLSTNLRFSYLCGIYISVFFIIIIKACPSRELFNSQSPSVTVSYCSW